ncbi:uncharacterized protein LOC108716734 [Xenopus laevis]|uniref:Uncharacterized protein LOC108716734 n=1 Tax=Xenopus laevis TaxID=8355 RepID=A0A8J1KPQ5_XENLA|nr:uncharacterized protein LOC108716734 [Xenopus laevis]
MSAQEAELHALARACEKHEGLRINVHTDSRYAFGIAHDFGPIWKARGFLTSSGKPIKHAEMINRLFIAFTLPLEVKAHTTETTMEAKDNAMADLATKEGTLDPPPLSLMLAKPPDVSHEEFKKLQAQAESTEKRKWATEGADKIWSLDGDWVVINKHQRQGLDARYTGPYQVLLTTSTSLKVEERYGWIHASHCKKLLDYQVQ